VFGSSDTSSAFGDSSSPYKDKSHED
jgi:hypothetical protein